MRKYGSGNSISIQVGIEIQFNGCIDWVCAVCLAGLPNNFSGIILSQHGMLETVEHHIVPKSY